MNPAHKFMHLKTWTFNKQSCLVIGLTFHVSWSMKAYLSFKVLSV